MPAQSSKLKCSLFWEAFLDFQHDSKPASGCQQPSERRLLQQFHNALQLLASTPFLSPRPATSKALESRDFRLFPTFFSQPSAWYTQMFPGGRKRRGGRGETPYPNLLYRVKYKTLRRSNFSSFSVPIVSSLTLSEFTESKRRDFFPLSLSGVVIALSNEPFCPRD